MAKSAYLPRTDDSLDEWADNFILQLPLVGPTLGVDPLEVTDVTTKAGNFKTDLNVVYSKKAELSAAVGQKNNNKKAFLDVVRPLVQRVKNHPAYDAATHGEQLDVIGPEISIDPSTVKIGRASCRERV